MQKDYLMRSIFLIKKTQQQRTPFLKRKFSQSGKGPQWKKPSTNIILSYKKPPKWGII